MPRSSVLELCCTLQRRLKTARLSNSSARTALSDGVAAVQRQSDAVAKEAEGLLQQATASSELVLQGTHAAAHEHGGDAPPLSSSVVEISSDSVLRRWAELRRRSTLDRHDAELLAVLSYTREVANRLESERANGQTLRARLAATVEPLRAAQALREEVIASNAAATEARRVAAQRMEDISKAMEETHQAMLRADAQHASQLAERDALLTRKETEATHAASVAATQISALQERLRSVQSKGSVLHAQVSGLKSMVKQAGLQAQHQQTVLQGAIQQALRELREKLSEAAEASAEAEERATAAEAKLQAWKDKYAEAARTAAQATEVAGHHRARMLAAQAEVVRVEQQRDEAREGRAAAKKAQKAAEAAKRKAEAARDDVKVTLIASQRQVAVLKASVEQEKAAASSALARAKAADQAKRAATGAQGKLVQECAAAKRKASDLQRALDKVRNSGAAQARKARQHKPAMGEMGVQTDAVCALGSKLAPPGLGAAGAEAGEGAEESPESPAPAAPLAAPQDSSQSTRLADEDTVPGQSNVPLGVAGPGPMRTGEAPPGDQGLAMQQELHAALASVAELQEALEKKRAQVTELEQRLEASNAAKAAMDTDKASLQAALASVESLLQSLGTAPFSAAAEAAMRAPQSPPLTRQSSDDAEKARARAAKRAQLAARRKELQAECAATESLLAAARQERAESEAASKIMVFMTNFTAEGRFASAVRGILANRRLISRLRMKQGKPGAAHAPHSASKQSPPPRRLHSPSLSAAGSPLSASSPGKQRAPGGSPSAGSPRRGMDRQRRNTLTAFLKSSSVRTALAPTSGLQGSIQEEVSADALRDSSVESGGSTFNLDVPAAVLGPAPVPVQPRPQHKPVSPPKAPRPPPRPAAP